MPGIGDDIESAMQQAPQFGRQSMSLAFRIKIPGKTNKNPD
jgi:hypothetical protein